MRSVYRRGLGAGKAGLRRYAGDRAARKCKAWRLHMAEALGSSRFSRPALSQMDAYLIDIFGVSSPGTFLEVGGNDGLQQSNTYALERELGWSGVLVEAVPQLAAEAARNRPNATVVCAAVTSERRSGELLGLSYSDLTTDIGGSNLLAPGSTLTRVIDATLRSAPTLLVVDVEGHEVEVIEGLDLERLGPDWLLIETSRLDEVKRLLASHYQQPPKQLSHHDYLFQRRPQ